MKIKNWKKFQHFKDRKPPWIKLYREIVYQADIGMISDWHFRLLISLWLLASEDKNLDGTLPSIEQISFVMKKTETEIAKSLLALKKWLILTNSDIKMISRLYQDDIKMISGLYQDDIKMISGLYQDDACDGHQIINQDRNPDQEEQGGALAPLDPPRTPLSAAKARLLASSPSSDLKAKKGIRKEDPLPLLLALTPEDPLTTLDHLKRKSKRTKTNNTKSNTKKSLQHREAHKPAAKIWDAYARAYQERYTIEPKYNARNYTFCNHLINRLGFEDALGVAEYYPSVRNSYDSARGHSLAMLLADCEKHCTAWKTGRQITLAQSREDDRLKASSDVWNEIIAEHQERDKQKQPVMVGESTVEGRVQQK